MRRRIAHGRQGERRVQALRQGVTDTLSAAGIEDDREVVKALRDADAGDVRNQDLVEATWDVVAIKVRVDRIVMPIVCGAQVALSRLDPQTGQPHDPRHFLVGHDELATARLMRHSPVSVDGELVLDVFDQGRDLGLRGPGFRSRRVVAEGAPRQVHDFASPSDRATPGPVTMDDLSLLAPRGGRGVFGKGQIHGQLPDLALQRGNLRRVFGVNARFGLFAGQLSSVDLRQPHVDEIRGDMVRAPRIAPTDHPGADILAQLQLERRRVSPGGPRDFVSLFPSAPVQRISSSGSRGPADGDHSKPGSLPGRNQHAGGVARH